MHDDEEELDETTRFESFAFHVHNGHGIPFQLESVLLSVNRGNGLIDHYNGPGFDAEQLSKIPSNATLSKQDALEKFMAQLDFKLAWKKDYECETDCYSLVYEACDRNNNLAIRYIDATTDKVICDRID